MIDKKNIPAHIAFIMDGNGRWAQERGLPRTSGHRAGIDRVKEIVRVAPELGIKVLTFFAFSTENWERPKSEINVLMRLFDIFLNCEIEELHKNNVRFMAIGRTQPIPEYLIKKVRRAEEKTKNNTSLTVVLALNYGARQEIVDAAKSFSASVVKQEASIEDLDEEKFSQYLYTADLPDPDLLIRTSGETRLSNFLLWQLSYAELYFPRKYWPDFSAKELEKAIKIYQARDRRFGRVNAGEKNN